MKLINRAIPLLLPLLILLPQAHAGTYKWIDKDGNVVYSQLPPPEGQFESIRIPKAAQAKQVPTQKPAGAVEQARELDVKRENERKVQAEVEKFQDLRKKNCDTAKQQLKIYTVYKRIQGKDGQPHRITDQEREAGLKEAKQGIKDYCD